MPIYSSLPLTNGKFPSHHSFMKEKTITMVLLAQSTGLTCNWGGETTTLMTLRGTLVQNSLIIRLMRCQIILRQLDVLLRLIWLTTCTAVLVTGLTEESSFFNKLWIKLWKLIQQFMYSEKEFVNVYNCTALNLLNPISIRKTTQNCLVIR